MTETKAAIHEELKALDNDNQLTPQAVVDRARNPKNVMHSIFTWDNKKAGDKWRLLEARQLIGYYEVRVVVHRKEYRLSEFVERPLKAGREQGYVSIQSLTTNEELAKAFLEEQLTTARTYVDKTRTYAVVLGLEKEVDEAAKALDDVLHGVRAQVQPAQPLAS